MNSAYLAALYELTDVFGELGVRYLVGGSLAATTWGEPRFTQDIDVVADLEPQHAAPLNLALTGGWYVDLDLIRAAIRARRSFNVIHLGNMMKIDVFVPPRSGHHAAKWSRAQAVRLVPGSERELWVTSPEDIVIQKLVWFREGGEVSEQQWRDVTSLLRIRAGRLDDAYLNEWAGACRVGDLLEKALAAE